MNRILLLAVLSFAACTKDEATKPVPPGGAAKADAPKAAEPAKPSGAQVADFPVSVEAPPNAIANDPLGAPGFHSEDGSISVLISKQVPEAPKDMAGAKAAIEEFAFKKWIKSDKTADGWVLTYVGLGIDMDGNTYDVQSFEVVKTIAGQAWRCSGSVKNPAHLDANLKLCASLKAI
jgi:hypothetical protein